MKTLLLLLICSLCHAVTIDEVMDAMDSKTTSEKWNAQADIDGDGEVTSSDLAFVISGEPCIEIKVINCLWLHNRNNGGSIVFVQSTNPAVTIGHAGQDWTSMSLYEGWFGYMPIFFNNEISEPLWGVNISPSNFTITSASRMYGQ